MRRFASFHRSILTITAAAAGLSPRFLFAQEPPPAPAPAPVEAPPAPTGEPPKETQPAAPTEPQSPTTPAAPPPAPTGEPVAPQDPAAAPADAGTTAPEPIAEGTILIAVRVGEQLIGDVEVQVDGQPSGVTGADAPTELSLLAGAHTLHLAVPASAFPERTGQTDAVAVDVPLNVVGGQAADVIVALDPKGQVVSLDVRPAVVTAAAVEPAQEAPTETESAGAQGKLVGRLLLAKTREPVAGAKVFIRRTTFSAVTDVEGKFSIDLPNGTYDLAIVHPDYATLTRERVAIVVKKTTQMQFELVSSEKSPDDYTITAKFVRGGVASVLEERRNASTVQDAIGSDDIAKSPDSTASSATRRVVGASIVGGQFLLVRGLGGRYSNVRLNGVPLPSTDPDLPGFQIDLFPASMLSNLTITKTFSADIPGDFAGGSLNVVTKDFPEKFTLNVSLGATINTETTFQNMVDYDGGGTDFLGFDDGTRALPAGVPPEKVVVSRDGFTAEDIQEIGQQFPNKWKLGSTTGLPNMSFSASLGDTTKVADRKFGYLLTLGYRANFQRYIEDVTTVKLENDELAIRDQLKREVGEQEAQVGALGTVSFEPAEGHKLSAVSVATQTGNDRTSLVTGVPESIAREVRTTQFRFIERQLLFNQLLGEHKNLAGPLKLNWQLNMAIVGRDQPDTRDLVYGATPNGYQFESGTAGSGERLYTELGQSDFGGGLDITFPVWTGTGKTGYLGNTSSRGFSARRFASDVPRGVPPETLLLPPEELFVPENYAGPDPVLMVNELTTETDGYQAGQGLQAGYAMFDIPTFGDTLRLIPGLRAEWFYQQIQSESPVEVTDEVVTGTDREDFDLLPAAAAVVSLTETTAIRASYGGTVARPLVRELSPFLNQDFVRGRTVQGNPDLVRTYIHNFDLRWELFPSGTEVFAASAFYKIFENPIESVVLDTGGNLTFENINGAQNYGLELEARFALKRFSDSLDGFSALANLAIIYSAVQLSPEQLRVATSSERPLAGQSPYVANLSLGYDNEPTGLSAYVYYNVFGRRLQDVGRLGLPDVYEEAFHSLDLSAFWKIDTHWTLGISGTNVLYQPTVVKQGDFNFSTYNKGSTYGAKIAWSY